MAPITVSGPDVPTSEGRFFIPARIGLGEELWLDGERAHYLSHVLRLRSGASVIVFDGHGGEYVATVGEITRRRVRLTPQEFHRREVESPLVIHLIQGIPRGERMDFVVQKATELGVHRITPAFTEFSVVRLDPKRAASRLAHWAGIAQSACEQCGRNRVPVIDPPQELMAMLAGAAAGKRLLLTPVGGQRLHGLAIPDGPLSILIGPEGGLSTAETAAAVGHGFDQVSIGPRVLRTETAAVAALAILQARCGDL